MEFLIGEKVTWKVGKIISKGCFLEDNENGTCSVITHFIGGQPANRQIDVNKELLKLDI